jgi:hypothetical protein
MEGVADQKLKVMGDGMVHQVFSFTALLGVDEPGMRSMGFPTPTLYKRRQVCCFFSFDFNRGNRLLMLQQGPKP